MEDATRSSNRQANVAGEIGDIEQMRAATCEDRHQTAELGQVGDLREVAQVTVNVGLAKALKPRRTGFIAVHQCRSGISAYENALPELFRSISSGGSYSLDELACALAGKEEVKEATRA